MNDVSGRSRVIKRHTDVLENDERRRRADRQGFCLAAYFLFGIQRTIIDTVCRMKLVITVDWGKCWVM